MDTRSAATVNSPKTFFSSKNIGYPVPDKQEKPSASHPSPTSLMTALHPTPSVTVFATEEKKLRMHRLSLTNTRRCLLPKGHGVVRMTSQTKGPVGRPSSHPDHRMRRMKGNSQQAR
ncbi:hypothetical protein CDAR_574331 [Caerostris darwini]|uniref:Uncharacterized protein n=1 Tax=Caerostris darwini TaxID=1538125 RepID=A0AAV4S4N6_9ARAC|nr:hypothetical protein CDAR_574331 [Caerostris darwini]